MNPTEENPPTQPLTRLQQHILQMEDIERRHMVATLQHLLDGTPRPGEIRTQNGHSWF